MEETKNADPKPSAGASGGPSLSYVALIATVLLASPEKKLNLLSIYRAMEEQFPHLRSRGPGWRNSVRHNLSVNSCFVKVSRCEDGRGHYWGVHQAHLRDFQRGDFRQYRRPRGRRDAAGERVAPQRPLVEQLSRQWSPQLWAGEHHHHHPLWTYLPQPLGERVSWWQPPLVVRRDDCFLSPPLVPLAPSCCAAPVTDSLHLRRTGDFAYHW